MNEVKAPSTSRQSLIATAGTRAFRKLPRATRAAAATALLAWAKAHIHSPAFKPSYCRLPERPDAKRPGSMFAPGLAKGPAGARSIAAATNQTIVVTQSGRIWTWGHVRAWRRPGGGGYSPSPMLLWIDGLEQPWCWATTSLIITNRWRCARFQPEGHNGEPAVWVMSRIGRQESS